MVTIEDVTRAADDLFVNGYCHEKPWSVELRHRLDKPVFTETASLNQSGALTCSSTTHILTEGGISLRATANLDGTSLLQAVYPTQFLPGFSTTTRAKLSLLGKNGGHLNSLEVLGDLKRPNYHFRGTVFPLLKKWKEQACIKQDLSDISMSLREEVSGNTDMTDLTGSAALSIKRTFKGSKIIGNLRITPWAKEHQGKVVASVLSDSTRTHGSSMGAQLAIKMPEEKTEMTIAANWLLDPKTKSTSIKARLDHEGKVATAITHKISDVMDITLGVQFDATKKFVSERDSNSTMVGLKLNLLA